MLGQAEENQRFEDFKSGMTLDQLAAKWGLSPGGVSSYITFKGWRKNNGVSKKVLGVAYLKACKLCAKLGGNDIQELHDYFIKRVLEGK